MLTTPPARQECGLCFGDAGRCAFYGAAGCLAWPYRAPLGTVVLYVSPGLWHRNAEELVTRAELAAELVRLPLGHREGGQSW